MSVDGKISSGADDQLDPDQDWKRISGVAEGLSQYYEIEQTTDLYNLNTGRVMAKIGMNSKKDIPERTPTTFFIIDNKPHLNSSGVQYLSQKAKQLYVVTNNKNHPAFKVRAKLSNVEVIFYDGKIDLTDLFRRMCKDYGIEHLTIQSGGTLNTALLRLGLIDRISIVMAPLLVGGKLTPTLFDGDAIMEQSQLSELKPLKLINCEILKDSYIRLEYDVLNGTASNK
jgi:2,5-diamino-6-(ribosylamino)-4(3H)-pyrimidinone 5'-phosphate reductase